MLLFLLFCSHSWFLFVCLLVFVLLCMCGVKPIPKSLQGWGRCFRTVVTLCISSSNLSLNHEGHWGTTDDFTTLAATKNSNEKKKKNSDATSWNACTCIPSSWANIHSQLRKMVHVFFCIFFLNLKKTNLDTRVNGGCSTQKVFQFLEGRIGTLHFVQVVFDHLHVASLRRDQTRLQQR